MSHQLAAPDLWFSANAMLARVLHLIGAATAPAIMRLARRQRAELIDWLVSLEAMVRKLLLIEAAALAGRPNPLRPTPSCNEKGANDPNSRAANKRTPAFNLIPVIAREARHPARIRQLGPAFLVRDIWREQRADARLDRLRGAPKPLPGVRLANRVAALLRVIENPLRHARRLARLMRRLARRAAHIARCIAAALLRRRTMDFHDAAFDQATRRASSVLLVNSS